MPISYNNSTGEWTVADDKPLPIKKNVSVTKDVNVYNFEKNKFVTKSITVKVAVSDSKKEIREKIEEALDGGIPVNSSVYDGLEDDLKTEQLIAKDENKDNEKKNKNIEKANSLYKTIYGYSKAAEPGRYLDYKKTIDDADVDTDTKSKVKEAFDSFYKSKIVSPWDVKTGAKVPFEGYENTIRFDPSYYQTTTLGSGSKSIWDNAYLQLACQSNTSYIAYSNQL